MFQTLRGRLIISHVLPLLIIVPLMGIALIYVLETQVILQNLADDLMQQAHLVAEITQDHTLLWEDADTAQAFVTRFSLQSSATIMLVNPTGELLASSDPRDAVRLGQTVETLVLETLQSGQASQRTQYSQRRGAQVVEVMVPVVDTAQQVVGAVHISHELASISDRFSRFRYLSAAVMIGGLALGAAIGWALAINLSRPILSVTRAVAGLARGQVSTRVAETGPREIRSLAESFNQLLARLQSLESMRRQLLANLVHELGRPLGALHSAIQALRRGADTQPALRDELLQGMDDEIGRLRRLLDDLAGLHGQVLGTLELRRQPTDMNAWLSHLLVAWRQTAQAKGLNWQEDIPDALPPIEIDPDRMGQALGNLLSNAIKFTAAGGSISVIAQVEEDRCRIVVGDTGPGIDPEEQHQIFDPFYRGQTHRRFPQGMGLGLSIARDIVVAHGGSLDLDSVPGQGSRFALSLPLNTER